MSASGVSRTRVQILGSDQEQAERSRSVMGALPLGDEEPLPVELLEDGSAEVQLPAEDLALVENPDGSVDVSDAEADGPRVDDQDFFANLAEQLDDSVLSTLSTQLLDNVDRDREDRKRRDEQYAEGIRRTGMGNEAPGGASFEGASRAVHPVLMEGCIDFAARAMKELFPPSGPVKARVLGKADKLKIQRAERKAAYMNWQATTQIREYRRELNVLLTQLPLSGGNYMKAWYDSRWERTRMEVVYIDDLLLPFDATSLDTASRKTHVQRLNRQMFEERVESGEYRDIQGLGGPVQAPEKTESAEAAAKVEGVEDLAFNEDGVRIVYECQCLLDLDKDDPLAKRRGMPYILTVDEATQQVLALRRNWDPDDNDKAEPLAWVVEFPFIPWRGAYPVGLTHLIGGLAGAATGALRALLDSAHINNTPGGLKLKGARVTGQTVSVEPTAFAEIEAGPGVDDIRKLAMPLPFNPPSNVLFELLKYITEQAKGVVGTAEEKISDATSQMPVGTALALIEQGSVTFSSIHSRLHEAQKQLLAILHRLNARHMRDEETVEQLGDLVAYREDFQGPMDIEPVSDPNIFSDAQRYAQNQAVFQLSATAPQLYKQAELHKRALRLLKIPAPEELLAVPEDPEELEPVAENAAATDPMKALKAYAGQDHVAHLQAHIGFATSPMFGANPILSMPTVPALLQHCREHLVMLYEENAAAAAQAGQLVAKMRGTAEAGQLALPLAEQELAKLLGPLMPGLQQMQQAAQKLMPPQQPDPRLASAQMQAQTAQARLTAETQRHQAELQLEAQRLQSEDARAAQAAQATAQAQALEHHRAAAQLAWEQQQQQWAHRMEEWQTRAELGTARQNAQEAAAQGDAQRELQRELQELKGEQERDMARLKAELDARLEVLRARFSKSSAKEASSGEPS